MKRTLFTFILLIAVVIFSNKGYSQQNNTVAVVYGTGGDGIFTGAPGAAGYASKGMNMVGLNYTRHIKGHFSVETGLEYSNSNLLWDYEDAYDPTFKPQMTSVKLLSVPVYGNFTFFKYAFLNAGFSLDIETDRPVQRIAPEQNGIGVFLGAGGKYTFRHVTLFVNPFFQAHKLIAFGSSKTRSMVDLGFKFGAGYSF